MSEERKAIFSIVCVIKKIIGREISSLPGLCRRCLHPQCSRRCSTEETGPKNEVSTCGLFIHSRFRLEQKSPELVDKGLEQADLFIKFLFSVTFINSVFHLNKNNGFLRTRQTSVPEKCAFFLKMHCTRIFAVSCGFMRFHAVFLHEMHVCSF